MTTSQNGRVHSGAALVPSSLDKRDSERRELYRRNLAFYNGEHWSGRMRGRERRLTFNYARAAVEKVTSYLMADIRSTVPPVDSSPEEQERARQAEHLLADIAEVNSLDQLDFDSEIDTAVLGDGAYKITWDERRSGVRITAPDVQGLHCWWVGDDVNRIRRIASRYTLDADEARELHGRPSAGTGQRSFRRHHHGGVGRQGISTLGGRYPHAGRDQPLRSHPVRGLSQHSSAQAVLGRFRYSGDGGADP